MRLRLRPSRAAAVGSAIGIHVAVGLTLEEGALLPGDRAVGEAVARLQGSLGYADRVMRLSNLGGQLPYVCVLVAGSGMFAVARGRPDQALALVTGTGLLVLIIPRAKRFWNRQRPQGMLVTAPDLSYPSAHTAYATALTACGVVTGRPLLTAAGMGGTAAVAFSRLYLRVHFLSDVLGGLALGVAAYGLTLRR